MSTTQDPEVIKHQPYIPSDQVIPEISVLPIVIGALLGIVFGASSTYLVLKVGMTISASIPVAVISITLFRLLSKLFGLRPATILENNIVQTTGSAGESIAFGVGVTMPALLILGEEMELARVMTVAMLGGLLGILMMIPLRRGLIVKQHGKLPYPEGTACAEVLIVGEQGGTNAKTVFTGFGIGLLYKFLMSGMRFWADVPGKVLGWFKGVRVDGELSPELLGVGYIIGPRTGCIMMAGGILSTLILTPLIKMFGEGLKEPLYPALSLISSMDTSQIRGAYVIYIGAGAVATGGIISVFSSLPIIWSALRSGMKDVFSGMGGTAQKPERTDEDLPMGFVVVGALALVFAIWLTPILKVNLLGAVLIMLFGFLFVTVSSRLVGEIGSSSNPISGMTVSTLLLTCLIFLALGWTGVSYRVTALSIAAVVCIAASNGGTTSQDLKTGFLVGATPKWQQIGILVGAMTSSIVIGFILMQLNANATVFAKPPVPYTYKADVSTLKVKEKLFGPEAKLDDKEYFVLRVNEPTGDLTPGKYLVDETGTIVYIVDPGINGIYRHRDADRKYVKVETPHAPFDVTRLSSKECGPQAESGQAPQVFNVLMLEQDKDSLKPGKYLIDNEGKAVYFVDPGPTVQKYNSPQAKLMSVIIDGILTQKLPWVLVLIGACIALIMELCQVSSLAFAVGVYLPFSSSVPIFFGGIIRWLVDSTSSKQLSDAEAESSPAVLASSGMIAGGSIAGIALAIVFSNEELMAKLDMSGFAGQLFDPDKASVFLFAMLCVFLYSVGRQWILKK